MAQVRGAVGPGDEEPDQPGDDVPDTPELWGNNGLVGDGRYRLTGRLGQGGMAEVFAAEDVRLGRPVAVKLLRTDLAQDPVSKARFTREAQSVAGLNHHAVVAVFDSGEEQIGRNVVPYIVMELVNGHTIRELLIGSETPPPPEQALAIVAGVLEALAYSHQHGIVHRDIKPANVIITETGSVKVMDFGIARALHGANQTMTQTGMVMGTPQYLSPEQALGKAIDTRSDLYAVGCLLYELLAQRPPFVGESPIAVVYQHVQDQPRLPSEVTPSSPPELDGLVMRALAKEPDDRFQTAEEMRGLVQYAIRMLGEHGGHTGGLWNTGAITSVTTPAMGTPTTPQTRVGGNTPPTGALTAPLLLGGERPGDDQEPPRRGGGRAKTLLFALLAVVAIGTGVLVAANRDAGDDQGPGPADSTQTTPEETRETDPDTDRPTEPTETDESTGDDYYPTDPDESPSETEGSETPTDSEEPTPTEPTETEEPTDPETDPTTPPEDDDQGSSDGGSANGDPGGEDDQGTSGDPGGTPGGNDVGGSQPGGTDAGAGDNGGSATS
ncbi:protein kinase [Streptomyces sp. 3MP-14]|uniref:protein kinase domain-containing protein n=1 Tax=Streptomyces sp. 3MP-14 TaxID=2586636 RepID=UPI00111A3E78|nr:protein kinase [Streptomyces sp. 3MP-14]KAB8172555.1 protein kinase [Streptomyces sp. 3MP-14]